MSETNERSVASASSASSRCGYCGKDHRSPCPQQIRMDIMELISILERRMTETDVRGLLGIGLHLRATWGFRDCVNIYFENGFDMRAALKTIEERESGQ